MNNKHTFLTYNEWTDNEIHKGTSLDHKGLSCSEIQQSIDEYIVNKSEQKTEIKRLNKLLGEILNENQALREFREWYQAKYDSD